MAGGDEFIAGGDRRTLGALLFLAASTNALDVYSALNSSPWTAESFGGNPEKAKSCREYVFHSIGVTSFFGVTSGIIAHTWWPIIGTVLEFEQGAKNRKIAVSLPGAVAVIDKGPQGEDRTLCFLSPLGKERRCREN